jgi:hypothetical protein
VTATETKKQKRALSIGDELLTSGAESCSKCLPCFHCRSWRTQRKPPIMGERRYLRRSAGRYLFVFSSHLSTIACSAMRWSEKLWSVATAMRPNASEPARCSAAANASMSGAVLIVGFNEQQGTPTQPIRPLNVVPIARVPLRLGKELRRSGSVYRVQLSFPTLHPNLPFFSDRR